MASEKDASAGPVRSNTLEIEAAERKIIEESRAAGVAAFSFDPNASHEQKVAQARAVC